MSRTLRRNKKHLINDHVGTFDEFRGYDWWLRRRYPGLTAEQAYERAVHRYTRDHHPGYFGVPRWYRRMHGSKAVRVRENQALRVHHRYDSWDAHIPESRYRSAGYY